MFTKKYCLLLTALISLIWLTNIAHANTLYKWVDEDGNVSYQDTPPPDNSEVIEEKHLEGQYKRNNSAHSETGKVNTEQIIIYTADNCSNCKLIIFQLENYQIPYREENLNDNRVAQTELLEKAGSLNIPTVLIGDTYLSEFNGTNLKKLLLDAGYPIEKEKKEESPETQPKENY